MMIWTLTLALAAVVVLRLVFRCRHENRLWESEWDERGPIRRWLVCDDCGHRVPATWTNVEKMRHRA